MEFLFERGVLQHLQPPGYGPKGLPIRVVIMHMVCTCSYQLLYDHNSICAYERAHNFHEIIDHDVIGNELIVYAFTTYINILLDRNG